MNQEISSWLVEWFASRGKSVGDALQVDYLQLGLLTSLEIVELVAAIEDQYGVQFSEADMLDPRFSTIGGLSELVAAVVTRDDCGTGTLEVGTSQRDDQSQVG